MSTKSNTSAPAPVVNDEDLDATVTQGEAELEAEGTPTEGTPEGDDSPSEPEVELSPVQLRNKLRAELVAAVHAAGIIGLQVLENREKEQALHAEAVKLREAGKASREAHKRARDEVARIRGLLKD